MRSGLENFGFVRSELERFGLVRSRLVWFGKVWFESFKFVREEEGMLEINDLNLSNTEFNIF